uniref:Claudin n=1 Tax=Oryzias melastigma TaxID=30732 RepID=A0A3B3CUM2_ORYME
MLSITLQILGFFLGIIGFIGTIIPCFLPMWKITTLNGANFEEILSEGLWMNCVTLSRGRGYDSQINLPEDLQIARVLQDHLGTHQMTECCQHNNISLRPEAQFLW